MAGRATLLVAALATVLVLAEGGTPDISAVHPCTSCCQGLGPCPAICNFAPCLRNGQCPKNTEPCSGLGRDQCYSDRDCKTAGERCCRRGCNRECLPTCSPRCGIAEECTYETFVSCLAIGCPPPPPPRSTCKPGLLSQYMA